MGVLLCFDICAFSCLVSEGETKVKGACVGSFGEVEGGEDLLELMEWVIIDLLAKVDGFFVFDCLRIFSSVIDN